MKRGFALAASACLLSTALLGCSIVDKFSSRAVDYNVEAERAQQQALFLNVIRASLRRPMQFTTVQSITGVASASGGVQYTAPVNVPFRSGAVAPIPPLNTWVLNGAMSGGPAFTVPVLDTQEFYQGILTPIQIQVFDYYLQEGFPPELLFDLLVSKIVVTLHDGTCRQFTFQNDVRDDLHFEQFQAFVDYLLVSGLTTERIQKVKNFGPPIAPADNGSESTGDAAKMVEAYSKASEAGLDIKKEKDGQYHLQKKSNEYRFCFSHHGVPLPDWLGSRDPSIFCGFFTDPQSKADADSEHRECIPSVAQPRSGADERSVADGSYTRIPQGTQSGATSQFRGIRLARPFLQRIDALQQRMENGRPPIANEELFDVKAFGSAPISFKVYIRSTEAILYYLGEVTRRHLFPEPVLSQPPRIIQVKTSLGLGRYPESECEETENGGRLEAKQDLFYFHRNSAGLRYLCENLFVAEIGPGSGNTFLMVPYEGEIYNIPADRERGGRSSQVMELVKQLLAINTSAKQLPTTTVISVVGP